MGLFINPGKSKIQALVLVGEKLGFDAKLMEHSGVKVAHMHHIFLRIVSKFIGIPIGSPAFNPSPAIQMENPFM